MPHILTPLHIVKRPSKRKRRSLHKEKVEQDKLRRAARTQAHKEMLAQRKLARIKKLALQKEQKENADFKRNWQQAVKEMNNKIEVKEKKDIWQTTKPVHITNEERSRKKVGKLRKKQIDDAVKRFYASGHFLQRVNQRIGLDRKEVIRDIVVAILENKIAFHRGMHVFKVAGKLGRYIISESLEIITTYPKDDVREKNDAIVYRPITEEERKEWLKKMEIDE